LFCDLAGASEEASSFLKTLLLACLCYFYLFAFLLLLAMRVFIYVKTMGSWPAENSFFCVSGGRL